MFEVSYYEDSCLTGTEDFQLFAMQSEKRDPLCHLPPFHVLKKK